MSLSASVGFGACGSDDPATQQPAESVSDSMAAVSEPPEPSASDATLPDTAPPDVSNVDTQPPPPETTIDESWREEAVAWCDQAAAALGAIAPPTSGDDLARFVQDHISVRDALRANPVPEWPATFTEAPYDINGLLSEQDHWIDLAAEQLAAGNVDGSEFTDSALGSIDFYRSIAGQIATIVAIGGAQCGPADPARAATAALNVPIFQAFHLNTGFDSVWVSNRGENQVHRIDPGTGATQAVIDVGAVPFRLQPADGRMVVRTADAYQFIDPATDAITDTLLKSDVGPAANRAWAVDGALWICDGPQIHRYDPTTLEPVTTIPLGFDCGNVHATTDLVIPWTYNEEPGESGRTTAALIDPATSRVRATIDIPVDVGVPAVVNDVVFFPATEGSMSVVVDKASGTVTSTPNLGRPYVHSNDVAYDGTYLYVMVEGRDIAVVDPATFEIVDTILPMDFDPPLGVQINALALSPGSLWVVNDESSILQRFDVVEPQAE